MSSIQAKEEDNAGNITTTHSDEEAVEGLDREDDNQNDQEDSKDDRRWTWSMTEKIKSPI